MEEQLLKAKQLRQKLKELIDIASRVEPNLASRLRAIQQPIIKMKAGDLASRKYLIKGLEEILADAEFWLCYRQASPEDQQILAGLLQPIYRYWYLYMFRNWFHKHDKKFEKWKEYFIRGMCQQNDANVIRQISSNIIKGREEGKDSKYQGADVLNKMVADKAMATDLMIVASKANPLCVQLTQSSDKHTHNKLQCWQETLVYWEIKRGLFASYNPRVASYINSLVANILSGTDGIKTGEYKQVSIK
ncbi:hypothetical protein SAMD00079811_64970 [Scytonema sp. HK-05]|uniref:hypothetical protein n=1 Tax=Scytonema sp. HK-05 TaxID=1137095 RepID=UPI000937EAB3|nr:hypothetical protein [Scytonema sp. HK-05]OKH54916.1 hypothetical protein NIES2130_27725 [Scytonema sp. HK-05]BAY48868.1 hypothetical protein SAMD00079811_64970 [Scytonema sp. HK-05]